LALHRGRKNRQRLDIIEDILIAALDGEVKTHITNKTNLTHTTTELYLEDLMAADLIEAVGEKKWGAMYRTTQKGVRFLSTIRAMRELLGESPGRHTDKG